MICSEARLAANRANAQKSTGPKTDEGKAASRRNGLKHGLAGEGVVLVDDEAAEVDRRAEALQAEMAPKTEAGLALIRQMAVLSVRTERAARHECAAVALKVRHAGEDFDAARGEAADLLFETLEEEPRRVLRKLKKSPEGVDRMLDEWADLRGDLARDIVAAWTASHMARAAHLMGVKTDHARQSRVGLLSRGVWGDFLALEAHEGGEFGEEGRKHWCRNRLFELIDAEVKALEAHRETLDFDLIALDRFEAPMRALFDPSKEATLARRYEAEARRGFLRALKEFRQVEAGAAAAPGGGSAPVATGSVGSVRDRPSATGPGLVREAPDGPTGAGRLILRPDGTPLVAGQRAPKPV